MLSTIENKVNYIQVINIITLYHKKYPQMKKNSEKWVRVYSKCIFKTETLINWAKMQIKVFILDHLWIINV